MKKQFELIRHNQYVLTASATTNKDNLYKCLMNIDYFDAPFSTMLEVMRDIDNDGIPIDATTIYNRISTLKTNLSIDDLGELWRAPIVFNFDEIMLNLKTHKNRLSIGTLAEDYKNGLIEIDSFLDSVQLLQEKTINHEVFGMMSDYLTDPDEKQESLSYFPTRIKSLDEIIDGYFQGDLFILAARPGFGKSALALQTTFRNKFAYFSLEMPKKQLGHRLISMYTGIHIKKLRKNLLNDDEKKQARGAIESLKQTCRITPIDSKYDIDEIIITIKMLHKTGRINGVVIDYLGLIRGGKGLNENLRIGYITSNLKQLAISLNIPIILLSQLNRESEKTDREPQLTDLRESGNIEQDADIILFIHQSKDEKYRNVFTPEVRLIIAKHRNGEIGKIDGIIFNKIKYKFEEKEVDSFDTLDKMDWKNN